MTYIVVGNLGSGTLRPVPALNEVTRFFASLETKSSGCRKTKCPGFDNVIEMIQNVNWSAWKLVFSAYLFNAMAPRNPN